MTESPEMANYAAAPDANPEVLALGYAEARETHNFFAAWADALDMKVIGIFSVASLVVALVPAVTELHPVGWQRLLWLGALVCWATAASFCGAALRPRDLSVTVNPAGLRDPRWRSLTPAWSYHYRIEQLAEAFGRNAAAMVRKTLFLKIALLSTGLEVLLLSLLLFLRG